MDGWTDGRMDGDQKFTSIFLILMYFTDHIYMLLIYVLKSCHQDSYGFQILMSSWGCGSKFLKSPKVGDFSIFGSKSSHEHGTMQFWKSYSHFFFSKIWYFSLFDGITIGRCVHHILILKVWIPIKKTATKPPAERSEANKVYIFLYL